MPIITFSWINIRTLAGLYVHRNNASRRRLKLVVCYFTFYWRSREYNYGYTGCAYYFPDTDTVIFQFQNANINPVMGDMLSVFNGLVYEVGRSR